MYWKAATEDGPALNAGNGLSHHMCCRYQAVKRTSCLRFVHTKNVSNVHDFYNTGHKLRQHNIFSHEKRVHKYTRASTRSEYTRKLTHRGTAKFVCVVPHERDSLFGQLSEVRSHEGGGVVNLRIVESEIIYN